MINKLFNDNIQQLDTYNKILDKAKDYLFTNQLFDKSELMNKLNTAKLLFVGSENELYSTDSETLDSEFDISKSALKRRYKKELYISKDTRIVTTIFYYAKLSNENYEYDTRNIYNICLKLVNAKNKNLKYWVASCITGLPEFQNYEKKWEYILSVPSFSPKEYSFVIFNRFVYNNFSTVPNEYRSKFIDTIKKFISDYPELYKANPKIYDETLSKLE